MTKNIKFYLFFMQLIQYLERYCDAWKFSWAMILIKTDDFRKVHLIQYSENHPEGNLKFPSFFVQHKTRHVINFESFILSNDEIENIKLEVCFPFSLACQRCALSKVRAS
jgi:hypothetical protein